MKRVLVLLAEGFEEIEAVTIIDVLRRAEVDVLVTSIGDVLVVGGHGIVLQADATLDAVEGSGFDAVVLPGGAAGAERLRDAERVQALLKQYHAEEKLVAAICAGPIALESAGVVAGIRATSYPGFELPSAEYRMERVVEEGHVVTSRGPGTALEFALTLVRRLSGHGVATDLRQRMLVKT